MINSETFKNLFKKWKKQSPAIFERLKNTDYETLYKTGKLVSKNKSVQLNKPQSKRYDIGEGQMTRSKFEQQDIDEKTPVEISDVDSSAVESIQYDPKKENLDVTFVGGGKSYRYPKVPKEVYHAFESAPSKGAFVNTVLQKYSNVNDPEVQKKIREGK